MSAGRKADNVSSENGGQESETANQAFSDSQLGEAWIEFAATRRLYQAEYQLLTQEYEIIDHQIVVHLHNPVQMTLLDTLRSDMTTFLRNKLGNNTIQVIGDLKESTEKKVVYTNREKFEHLAEKNPTLKQLKERLGLDPDF
jgi:DNA polymerase-3 subunit gamma/tau